MKKGLLLIFALLGTFILCAQNLDFINANKAALEYINKNKIQYDRKRNIYVNDLKSPDKIIYVFLFQDGNLLSAGYPSTATDKDKIQIILIVDATRDTRYVLQYTGSYTPTLNIQNGNAAVNAAAPTFIPLPFSILGPFTGSLQITLNQISNNTTTVLASTTIPIAKTIHINIGSGLIYTSLSNPTNIKKIPVSGSVTDSTLSADNTGGRGMLTLIATFYPGGRSSLYIPSKKFIDHFGIQVGTPISASSSNFKDILFGFQYDFAAGGSFVAGVHFGERQKILGVNYKDFKFGETVFNRDLANSEYQQWGVGIYFGVQIDSRVFNQLFSSK